MIEHILIDMTCYIDLAVAVKFCELNNAMKMK